MRLGDQHAQEAVLLHERPDVLGDLLLLMPNLPVVAQPAEFLRRSVQEGALLLAELDLRHRAQLRPVRPAAEDLGVEADGPGIERLLLGLRHLGQDLAHGAVGGVDDERAADRRHRQ